MLLINPRTSMPWLIALTVLVHFSLQILSISLYSSEVPVAGAALYMLSGLLTFLVAVHITRKGIEEKSQQFLFMGVGMVFLSITFILLSLGLFGLFGPIDMLLVNFGMFLLISGTGLSALFLMLSPSTTRLKSGNQKLIVAMVLLILFVVGLYQLRFFLPSLYSAYGIPTLLRQQLITVVLLLYSLAAVRFALSEWGKSPKFSVQWYLIGIMVLTLVMLNFLLSTKPGDGYSWAGRIFTILASGAFIQYLWWDQRGE